MRKLLYGLSIKGWRHCIENTVCQDYNSYTINDNDINNPIKVIAVSDGHGGAQYFRSDRGSKFVVEIAKKSMYDFINSNIRILDEIDELYEKLDYYDSFKYIKYILEKIYGEEFNGLVEQLKTKISSNLLIIKQEYEKIKKQIVSEWDSKVLTDLKQNEVLIGNVELRMHQKNKKEKPFNVKTYISEKPGIIQLLGDQLKEDIVERLQNHLTSLYGATLVCVGNYKNHIFAMQVGDGDITIIDDVGNAINVIQKNEHEATNITDSICDKDVLDKFKQEYIRQDFKFIMVNTDGITNGASWECENGKGIVGTEAVNLLASELYNELLENSREFKKVIRQFMIEDLSMDNGDDMSLCFIANNVSDIKFDVFSKSIDSTLEFDCESDEFLPFYELHQEVFDNIKNNSKALWHRILNKFACQFEELHKDKTKNNILERFILRKKNLEQEQNLLISVEKEFEEQIDIVLDELTITTMKYTIKKINYIDEVVITDLPEHYALVTKINDRLIEYMDITKEEYDLYNNDKSLLLYEGNIDCEYGRYYVRKNKIEKI